MELSHVEMWKSTEEANWNTATSKCLLNIQVERMNMQFKRGGRVGVGDQGRDQEGAGFWGQ